MPILTKKFIEEIVEKRINSSVEYIGFVVNEELVRIRPKKFCFFKIEDNGDINKLILVKESDISHVIKRNADIESKKISIQNKLI